MLILVVPLLQVSQKECSLTFPRRKSNEENNADFGDLYFLMGIKTKAPVTQIRFHLLFTYTETMETIMKTQTFEYPIQSGSI